MNFREEFAMEELQTRTLDQAAFQRVWQRVMPEPRPDCPFTVDPPPMPAPVPPPAPAVPAMAPMGQAPLPVCLGEASAAELPALERLLDGVEEGAQTYQALARRWRREELLPALAREKRQQAKRLSAARFLIAGERYASPAAPPMSNEGLALRLRGRFQAEQRMALQFFAAANAASDPCLIELYRELARGCQDSAQALRAWMEKR